MALHINPISSVEEFVHRPYQQHTNVVAEPFAKNLIDARERAVGSSPALSPVGWLLPEA
jgi:hypothetical protein